METRANYVAVGAFVLIVLAGIVGVVLWLARVEFNREFAFYDIYFSGSVTGLAQGSEVRYNGIRVGRVTEIRIDPQNLQQVRVTVELDQTALIKSDAVASLEVQGLTGSAYIEISGGSQAAPPLVVQPGQRYPVIASQQSGLQRVFANAPEVLARLLDVADKLNAILDEHNRTAIADTLDNVRRLTAVAAARSGDVDSVLGDSAAAVRELRGTLSSANQVLDALRELIGEHGDARLAMQGIGDASRKLDKLAGDLDALVQENRPPLRDFSQRGLNELSQLIIDARTLVGELTRLSDAIERDPTHFLFGGNSREGYQPR
jgi:phospholipid/cholesterol/gamma-HCH transport system substrate-binding protein